MKTITYRSLTLDKLKFFLQLVIIQAYHDTVLLFWYTSEEKKKTVYIDTFNFQC